MAYFAAFIFGVLIGCCNSENRNIYGPKCLSCTGAHDPSECTSATACWASQKCYTERYMHADGRLLYDFGCKIKEECELLSESRNRRLDITIDLCEECCEGEFCNVNNCANRTEIFTTACYSCQDQDNPDDCHQLKRCGQGEICYAEKLITDSPHPRYTMDCLSQQVCSFLNNGAQPIGKRSTHLCQKCCSTSGCNVDICGDNQTQQTTNTITHGNTIDILTNATMTSTRYTPSATYPSTTRYTTASTTQFLPEMQSVRLVNGSVSYEGRVEILYRGVWGTICGDGFGTEEAGVICHMLGHLRDGAQVFPQVFGIGTTPIWLDEVSCNGYENDIFVCSHNVPGANDCSHSEDVGVKCVRSSDPVRLVGDGASNQGRVEIYYNGQWGNICDDSFGSTEAGVVCHMLGYSRQGATAWSNARFGQGSGNILLDDVSCTGNETSIWQCRHLPLGSHNCGHNEDAGVTCVPEVRLVGDGASNQGRVEIYYNGQWGTICDDSFGSTEAGVVCHMLGYRREGATAWSNAHFGQGSGNILLDDVSCTGKETSIWQCSHIPIGSHNCGHNEDAGVTCVGFSDPVRLVGGGASNKGRVEIQYNGQWGTICDDIFGSTEAGVVCHMLGYPREGATALSNAHFGQGSGNILLDDVSCTGDETSIWQCSHIPIGSHDCGHNEDAGVTCVPEVRLAGGGAINQGRVEIYYNGQWGTICDDRFGSTEAGVVCHMLGYRREGATAWSNAHFGQGSGNILLDDVSCTGKETSIWQCSHIPIGSHNCGHSEDAGVTCELSHCPHGFLTHNGSCYSFDNNSSVKSYVQAAADCSDRNATLVDVETVEEYEYIAGVAKSINGSTGEWLTGVRYVSTGWMLGDLETPLNRDLTDNLVRGPCLSFVINHSYSWVDVNCDGLPRNYICKRPLV